MEQIETKDICFYGPENQEIRGDFYRIERTCQEMVKTAIKGKEEYRKAWEENYEGKYSYFSDAMDFCIHELGFKVALPVGVMEKKTEPGVEKPKQVLFSAGSKLFVTSIDKIKDGSAMEVAMAHLDMGMPHLTDEAVSFDPTLTNIDSYDDGIVTTKGYVSSKCVKGSLKNLASLMLVREMSASMELCDKYRSTYYEGREPLSFFTDLPNVIAVDNLDNGTFALSYVSENTDRVEDFINALKISGKLAELDPMVVESVPTPMVIDEERKFRM